jgi:hypothetical protein
MRYSELKPEEKKAIIDAGHKAWNYVMYDAFELVGGEGGSLKRSEVAEFAFDAGRPVESGKLSKELYEKYLALDNAGRLALEKEAFPAKRYYA